MQAIEFETLIDKDGQIQMPQEFKHAYGKIARLVVLLPEQENGASERRQAGGAEGRHQLLSEDGEKPVEFSKPRQRVAGLHQGAARVSEDFDEPLPDEFWMGNQ
jgi:hypothetical protein